MFGTIINICSMTLDEDLYLKRRRMMHQGKVKYGLISTDFFYIKCIEHALLEIKLFSKNFKRERECS